MKKAVVLLSGGLDSYTTAAVARHEGYALYALSFDYDQRHRHELKAAQRIAQHLGVADHFITKIDLLSYIGGSALTDAIPVPEQPSGSAEIPVTYVPARNIMFLSYATSWAEVLGARDLFIGVNAVDYSGYPDCRPEFIEAFQHVINTGTRAGVEGRPFSIHTPLINMTKNDIILRGISLGCDYAISLSCYQPDEQSRSCGVCDSCRIRKKGFHDAGVSDPTLYVT